MQLSPVDGIIGKQTENTEITVPFCFATTTQPYFTSMKNCLLILIMLWVLCKFDWLRSHFRW